MKLSIITPAAPGRFERIEMIFKRLALNARRHEDIDFEFIIVDDSKDAEYRDLSQRDWPYRVKYVNLPLTEPYPNPSYMRNVGFRIAEGEIFTMIDADHWVGEDFVWGAINTPDKALNTGFMIDTSKGNEWHRRGVSINEKLIAGADELTFAECMQLTGIKGPIEWNKVWLASYPSDVFLEIRGYDEKYTTGYSREDDDIYFRLASRLPVVRNLFQSFCGVHLWHPQGARNDAKNALNRAYYDRMNPQDAVRNKGHDWGKFVEGSFSIIDGKTLHYDDHEQYVADLMRVIGYTSKPWKDFAELQECVTKK